MLKNRGFFYLFFHYFHFSSRFLKIKSMTNINKVWDTVTLNGFPQKGIVKFIAAIFLDFTTAFSIFFFFLNGLLSSSHNIT